MNEDGGLAKRANDGLVGATVYAYVRNEVSEAVSLEALRWNEEGFVVTPAKHASFVFRDLPWLKPERVERVGADGVVGVHCERGDDSLGWRLEAVYDVALFRVAGSPVFSK